jgi:hypothetical protein
MIDKALPPNIECYDIPEAKPDANPNPFKRGESVRLRDGTAANGTVMGTSGNEVRVAWEGIPGDPQWYHQDYLLKEKRPAERGRAPPWEAKPDANPNPFKIGESVRLRDRTFTNGTVREILGSEVRVAWDHIPGDPRWYHQDFIIAEKQPVQRRRAPEDRAGTDIVDQACRLVAMMDDDQRRRFIAHMQETYSVAKTHPDKLQSNAQSEIIKT